MIEEQIIEQNQKLLESIHKTQNRSSQLSDTRIGDQKRSSAFVERFPKESFGGPSLMGPPKSVNPRFHVEKFEFSEPTSEEEKKDRRKH